jgi:hypothetical protein
MNNAIHDFAVNRRRRPRPPGPPLNSIADSFADSLDRRGDQHAAQARPYDDRNRIVAAISAGAPTLPSPPDGAKPETVPTVPLYQGGAGGNESRSLEDVRKYGSSLDIEDSEHGVPSRYSGTVGTVSDRDAFLKRISELRHSTRRAPERSSATLSARAYQA